MREGNKTETILDLLKRPGGVTAKELMKATGWQPHSVRGFVSGMSEPVCSRYRTDLLEYCKKLEEQAKIDRRNSAEGKLVAAFLEWTEKTAPTCKDLVHSVIDADGGDDPRLSSWLTPNRASKILRGMGFQTRHTNHGSEVTIDAKGLRSHCERFGLEVPQVGDGSDDGDVVEGVGVAFAQVDSGLGMG